MNVKQFVEDRLHLTKGKLSGIGAIQFAIFIVLIALASMVIYFVITGFTQDNTRIAFAIVVLSAVFSAVSAISNFSQTVHMILQREAEERPYLVPYFEKIDDKKAAFIIENVGRTPALSVKLAVVGKDPNNSPFPFPFNQEIPVIAPASPLLAMAYEYEINYELEMVLKLEYYSSEGKNSRACGTCN